MVNFQTRMDIVIAYLANAINIHAARVFGSAATTQEITNPVSK